MNTLSNSNQPTIGFYIHHHGSGHLMRAVTIALALKGFPICFLGSNLKPYHHLIPSEIECIHLPADLPNENETSVPGKPLTFLHYAPIGISGIRERNFLITETFKNSYPMLLVADVSVEVTMLARLCSVPAIVIRQHGNRTDLPHLLAYESAELIIAPFSESMAPADQDWIIKKTFYAGGFSKYTGISNQQPEKPGHIAIILGQGGSSIDVKFVNWLADCCKNHTFHVIGQLKDSDPNSNENGLTNIHWHSHLDEPAAVLSYCTVVIGNAGHNTVMEMADLNKRFICIPENRPFEEQQQKADFLSVNHHARVVQPADLRKLDWSAELTMAAQKLPYWLGVINKNATENIAAVIKDNLVRLFK